MESDAGGGGRLPAGTQGTHWCVAGWSRRPPVPACHPLRPSRGGCLLPAWQQGAAPVHDAAYSQFLLPQPPVHCTPRTARFNTKHHPTLFPSAVATSPAMFSDCLAAPGSPAPLFMLGLGSTMLSAARAAPWQRSSYTTHSVPRALSEPLLDFSHSRCFRLNFITSPSLRIHPTHRPCQRPSDHKPRHTVGKDTKEHHEGTKGWHAGYMAAGCLHGA